MEKRISKKKKSRSRRVSEENLSILRNRKSEKEIVRGVHGAEAEHRVDGQFATQLTSQKRLEFLARLRHHSNVTQACEEIGFSKVSLYAHRKRDEEFAQAWDEAAKDGVQCLEDEAKRRAMGYEEKVYKNGVYVGKVRKYSDLLLLALLNAHWPEKYRRSGVEQSVIPPEDQRRIAEARDVLKRLSTDELSTIATVMEKATTRAVAQAVGNSKRVLQ